MYGWIFGFYFRNSDFKNIMAKWFYSGICMGLGLVVYGAGVGIK